MSSVVEICNRALSELGTQSFIASLDEGSNEAAQCKLWYDNQRQGLLRSAPWGFARRQLVLSQIGDLYPDATSPYPWLWKYAYPADCLKFRYILAPPIIPAGSITPPQVGVGIQGPWSATPSRSNRYIITADVDTFGNQTKSLVSNIFAAIGVYTLDVTNPDIFDTSFESALAASLAYKLCIPLSGNVGMREQFREAARDAIMNARANDGNEAIPTSDHVVDWMAVRAVGGWDGTFAYQGSSWGQCTASWDNFNGWGM